MRPRLIVLALFLAVAGLVAVVLVTGGGSGPDNAARRWVDVQNWALEDCSVLELYSEDYLREHGFERSDCTDDPSAFFTYWYMEAETQDSTFELGAVTQEGDRAVASVREVGGTVPDLLLFLVTEDGEWVIEAVGATPPA